jgi:hypothetical protein
MRKMKTNLMVLLGLVVITIVAMIGPASAAGSSAATTITGNPTVDIAITANTTSREIVLLQGQENFNDTLSVNVKSNAIAWDLKVKDPMDTEVIAKPGTPGHMENWTGSQWDSVTTELFNPMKIQGSSVAGATQAPEVTLSNSDGLLETGLDSTPTGGLDFIMKTHQAVVFGDRSLPSPNTYRIVFAFTGTTL